jgi:hypothetical protein
MTVYTPIHEAHATAGHVVRWSTWDGDHSDTTTIRWENEGYTVTGQLTRERVDYVLRLSATWQVRQFILFRDLEEPDLWLATDGAGRWGEMNGAHRTELDGCYDVHLGCTPFPLTLPIRRLPLLEGHTAEIPVVTIDTETLEVQPALHRYTRLSSHRWRLQVSGTDTSAPHTNGPHTNGPHTNGNGSVDFDVDEFGLVLDYPEGFRRVS